MRYLLCCLAALLCLSSTAQAQLERLPEFNSYRYGVMYYSVYDDINGYVLKGRVRPHYTMGVLDTIIIDSQMLPVGDYKYKWRIRYEPTSLTPKIRYMEQWNGAWVRYQTDTFKYANGLRIERSTQRYVDGLPLFRERTFYVYDDERRLKTSQEDSLIDGEWIFKVKHGYFYNGDNLIEGIDDSTWKIGPKGTPLFLNWTRERWDYFDDKLDEINREKNLFPFAIWAPIERFRYTLAERRDTAYLAISDTLLAYDTTVGQTQSRFFTVKNPGKEASSVSRLDFIETGSFTLHGVPEVPFTIMPGDSIVVEARYNPLVRGTETDSVVVFLDGQRLPSVLLVGTSHQGVLQLDNALLDFDSVLVDSLKPLTFKLTNIGDASLVIDSAVSDDPHFVLGPVIGDLSEGASDSPAVVFGPTDTVHYAATVRVYYHDGLNARDTALTVIGVGYKPHKPDSVLSVDRIDLASMISISPNPASSMLTINAGGLGLKEAYIVSIAGSSYEVPMDQLRSGRISLDSFSTGVYYLILITNEGQARKKFVIEEE